MPIGREIALTLSSSWIMNAVSINVCIIHQRSTNRTSVEPVVLSDAETGLHHCLRFAVKRCADCHVGGRHRWRKQQPRHLGLFPLTEQCLIVLVWMGKYLFNFTQERQEKWGGNRSRKWRCDSCICFFVFSQTCYLVPPHNAAHLTLAVRDMADLMAAFSSSSLFFFKVETAPRQGNLFKTSQQNPSLS